MNQYAKALAHRTEWTLKKKSGDLAGHGKSLRDYVSLSASPRHAEQEESDRKLSAIVTKAEAGGKLTRDDWDYLRVKAPELYAKLREIEREQENYEEALRRCKTRDEAQRLHVSKLGEILTAAKNGDGSALFRLNRMTQSMIEFTESEAYHDLPTEGEQAVEREAERREKWEALLEEAAQKQAEAEDAARNAAAENGETAENAAANAAENGDAPAAEDGRKDAAKSGDAPAAEGKDAADIRRAALRTAERAIPRRADAEKDGAPAKRESAPAVQSGRRAYLDRQGEEARERSRRRTVDTEA